MTENKDLLIRYVILCKGGVGDNMTIRVRMINIDLLTVQEREDIVIELIKVCCKKNKVNYERFTSKGMEVCIIPCNDEQDQLQAYNNARQVSGHYKIN